VNSDSLMSVLLVDDDPHACALVELVMRHHNVPLAIVSDAETALDYLRSHSADVIIMDLFLPGIDGYQALSQIRRSSLANNARVIASTAYYTNDTQQEVLRWGFDGYLPKPIEAGKLVPYLRSVLHGNKD
jgi:DNA-binding response OmpR family regulator